MHAQFQSAMSKIAEPPPPKGWSAAAWDQWLQKHPPSTNPKFPPPKEKKADFRPSTLSETLGRAKYLEERSRAKKRLLRGTKVLGVLRQVGGVLAKSPTEVGVGATMRMLPTFVQDASAVSHAVRGIKGFNRLTPADQAVVKRNLKIRAGAVAAGTMAGVATAVKLTDLRSGGTRLPPFSGLLGQNIVHGAVGETGRLIRRDEVRMNMLDAQALRKRMGVRAKLYEGIPELHEGVVVQKGDLVSQIFGMKKKLLDPTKEKELLRDGGIVVPIEKSSSVWPTLASALVQ